MLEDLADHAPPHTVNKGYFADARKEARAIYFRLRDRQLASLIDDARCQRSGRSDLRLHPNLAVRHAGGMIFQEAHFEIIRAPAPDLFGLLDAPSVRAPKRGGTHFTPPCLRGLLLSKLSNNLIILARVISLFLSILRVDQVLFFTKRFVRWKGQVLTVY